MRLAITTLTMLVALGCGGEGGSARSSTPLSAPEGEATQRADVEPVVVLTPPAASDRPLVTIHALPPGDAEDGAGNVVQASAPVAIDLDAHAFPPRALDPILEIGQLRFRHYAHPHVGVMRFVIADASLLGRGLPLSVHYLPDASDERVLIESIGDTELAAAVQP